MTSSYLQTIKKETQKGFTLIELLIVIGILAVLMGIVLIAINPARQFAQANNTKRASDVKTILDAVGQYMSDNKGDVVGLGLKKDGIEYEIQGGIVGGDICTKVVPTYVAALPTDPTGPGAGAQVDLAGCTASSPAYDTGYKISVDADGRVTVYAPDAELSQTIQVTR